jgi:transcriptional regulator with XRE-family HTH domain
MTVSPPITLGSRIREARGAMTQDELADAVRSKRPKLKVTGVRISRYERNVQTPRLSVLVAIAEATDKPLDFFRVDDETPHNGDGTADAEDEEDAAVMMRAAYHLERTGEYALSDMLRARARAAALRAASAKAAA